MIMQNEIWTKKVKVIFLAKTATMLTLKLLICSSPIPHHKSNRSGWVCSGKSGGGCGLGQSSCSCLESLRGESELMTLGNLSCTGGGTGNGGGVGCTGGKVVCSPLYPRCSLPPARKKGGPPLTIPLLAPVGGCYLISTLNS